MKLEETLKTIKPDFRHQFKSEVMDYKRICICTEEQAVFGIMIDWKSRRNCFLPKE